MKKRLYRDVQNKMISGVCAGIAKYFDLDPTIIRLIWVIVTLAGGSGLIAYIVCAFVIPEEPEGYTTVEDAQDVTNDNE